MSVPLWSSATADLGAVERIAITYGLPTRVARVLCTRVNEEDIHHWLDPQSVPYHESTVFTDMDKAINRIRKAIRSGEKIGIIGDYDVDGVTSTTILATTLEALQADFDCYIPHRVDDGYGLSRDLVDRARQGGCQLIVTVDNGIRANDAVRYAVLQGIEVIVTDHHEPSSELPLEATAIIHFVRAHDQGIAVLSGAGVAWKLASALLDKRAHRELLDWHLGLAALGALADIMPMKGENRRLVREGLLVLERANQPGWLALCEVAGVDRQKLNASTILWSITPRINAAGRMGSAELALRLLRARDAKEAKALALEVEETNTWRRSETTRSTDEAMTLLEGTYPEGQLPSVIVVAGPWPLGVVGIVAAKLVETYGRPAIVFADDGGDMLRGSGRAPDGTPFHDAVSQCAHHLEHFGGHATALGCGVLRQNLNAFAAAVAVVMDDVIAVQGSDDAGPETGDVSVIADDYLPLGEASLEVADWLVRLGPYGPGYPPYRFYVGPVEVLEVTPMGAGKHLRLTVREGKQTARLIWFRPPAFAFELARGSLFAAVVGLEVNSWQGRTEAQLRVDTGWLLGQTVLREDFAKVYRVLQARRKLLAHNPDGDLTEQSGVWLQTIFDTFVDLGFAYLKESAYHVVEQAQTRDLRESIVYQAHLREAARGQQAIGQ